jgi:mediator of RNA polymerase II transcription subunit 6
VTLAHYYVLAGIVYRAPDLWSLINSRLLNTSHFLCSAAAELNSFVRYHPSNGYHWEIKNPPNSTKMSFVPIDPAKKEPEDAGTQFQRKNVDLILGSLTQRFPFKQMPTTQHPYGPRLPADQLHSTREVAPSLTPGSLPAEPTPATQNQNKTGPDHQLFNTVKGGR